METPLDRFVGPKNRGGLQSIVLLKSWKVPIFHRRNGCRIHLQKPQPGTHEDNSIINSWSLKSGLECDFTYMWNLMNKINKQNRNRLTNTQNRLTAVRREGGYGLSEKGEGIKQHKLVAAEQPHRSSWQHGEHSQ